MAVISMAGNKRINMEEWYTHEQALARLIENAGRPIDRNYPRTLAKYNKVDVLELGKRTRMYRKRDIDAYVVSTKPGRKPAQGKIEAVA
jgi:hypothetical protein